MMGGFQHGWSMGIGGFWMILLVILLLLTIVALLKYLMQ